MLAERRVAMTERRRRRKKAERGVEREAIRGRKATSSESKKRKRRMKGSSRENEKLW